MTAPTDSSPNERLLLRGYAPLVVAVILAVLAVLLVPSVAPEQVIVRPAGTTTTSAPPTTAPPPTAAPAPVAPAPPP